MRFISLLVVCLFSILLSSCERKSQYSDLEQQIKQLQDQEERKQKKLASPSALHVPTPATYTAKALRSPFSQTAAVADIKPVKTTNPLQAYGLNMLRFVGTIQKASTTFAYVLTPDNTVYQVKEGDIIGDRSGKVFKITADRLEVREEEPIREGVSMQRIITLQLKGQ